MNELLQAAKAVIDCWDIQEPWKVGRPHMMSKVEKLRIAVERAESCQPVWLTDDEVKQVIKQTIPDVTVSESVTFRAIARAIKAAVLEKNQ